MLQDKNLLSSNAANNRNPSGDGAIDLIKVPDDDGILVGGITICAVDTIVSISSGQLLDDIVPSLLMYR